MRMKTILKSLTIVMILAASAYWLWYAAPFKVKDPSDPKFNPDKFAFRDYNSKDELTNVFRVLFPLGTGKEKVDKILVKSGRATAIVNKNTVKEGEVYINYNEPSDLFRSLKGTGHNFVYDSNNELVQIYAYGGAPVHDIKM